MNSASRKPTARKSPGRSAPKPTQLSDAEIDAIVKGARGTPGYRVVREFGALMKLGPFTGFKKFNFR